MDNRSVCSAPFNGRNITMPEYPGDLHAVICFTATVADESWNILDDKDLACDPCDKFGLYSAQAPFTERASLWNHSAFFSEIPGKVLRIYLCQLQDVAKRTDLQLVVQRDDRSYLAPSGCSISCPAGQSHLPPGVSFERRTWLPDCPLTENP